MKTVPIGTFVIALAVYAIAIIVLCIAFYRTQTELNATRDSLNIQEQINRMGICNNWVVPDSAPPRYQHPSERL